MRTPQSTYRLQLHKNFGFRDAAKVVEYFAALGISELYLSPIFTSAPGSTHGYDVLDPTALNPELGGDAGFEELAATAQKHGLGLTVDFVPNHMGVGCDGNPYWDDVLKHGQASRFAEYFDIDWCSPKPALAGKVLLPVLADDYGTSLERGDITLGWFGTPRVCVGGRRLPVRPQSLGMLLRRTSELIAAEDAPLARALRDIGSQCDELVESATGAGGVEYSSAAAAAETALAALLAGDSASAAFCRALRVLSGTAGLAPSFDFLDALLRAQAYRVSYWRLALEAINYRRFFNVDQLAGIRIELPNVFETVHAKLLSLVASGLITGIRLDHIDGLYDPIGYLGQLDAALRGATVTPDGQRAPLHVTVEKILAPDEHLPAAFIAHGTTGYEFIRVANGVLLDQRAEAALTSLYRRFTGDQLGFSGHLLQAKRDILGTLLASDALKLSHDLERLAEQSRQTRDLPWHSLQGALVEVMAAFGTYRSYVRPNGDRTADDDGVVNRAIADALRLNPTTGRGAYLFLRALLLQTKQDPETVPFAMRFQQTTGPVTAKSLEDTAFYRYARFVAENEVGGQPERLGVPVDEFHAQNAARAQSAPLALLASSTHDTKRGEDVRARLAVISELPNTWRRVVLELARAASPFRSRVGDADAPTRSDEYLYYQNLLGALPFGAGAADFEPLEARLQAYMLKAGREAKTNTSWLHPVEEYERAVAAFVSSTLRAPLFVETLRRFGARIDSYGACNSLAQVALKMCSPGVPDTYQGSELWHQVLVDPDNRRPVDYARLRQLMEGLQSEQNRADLCASLLDRFPDGSVKLFVVRELLRLRRERGDLFDGVYEALEAGPNGIAFSRGASQGLLCAVPRLPFQLTRGRARWPLASAWGEQRLRADTVQGRYRNAFTGQQLQLEGGVLLSELFQSFPVAVLTRD